MASNYYSFNTIKTRDSYKALGNTEQFKKWRNKVVNLIKQSKKSNYEKLIDDGKNQPNSIYKIFQELGAGKRKSKNCNNIILKNGDSVIDQTDEIANEFNNFFVNIAENIKQPLISSNHEKLSDFC